MQNIQKIARGTGEIFEDTFKTFDQQTKSFLDKIRSQIYESIAKVEIHALIVADF